jgi:hypothetical protein
VSRVRRDTVDRPVATKRAARDSRGEAASPGAGAWMAFAAILVAACTIVSVSYRLYEGDLWRHLLVGKVTWLTHRVPTTQQWSWPRWGEPEVYWAWLFRALLWPFWGRRA